MSLALLVVDMQVGLFQRHTPRYDAEGVVHRINRVAQAVRALGGNVIFIQHDGRPGESLEPETAGWEILPALERTAADLVIRKRACDAFYETDLAAVLQKLAVQRLIIGGCATDFCVDTTVRAAASRDYEVVVVSDGHTTMDRSHLKAKTIIRHHNWVWENLILPRGGIEVEPAESLVRQMQARRAT